MISPTFSTSQWLVPFGAVEILLPAAIIIAAWSAITTRSSFLFRVWILPLCIAAALTGASKLAFFGWGVGIAAVNFTVISGHAIFSAAIYPVVACLLVGNGQLRKEGLPWRKIAIAAGFAFALIVAFSRIRVAAHSWSEIIVGALLGSLVSGYALWRLKDKPQPRPPFSLALLGVAAWFVVIPLKAAPSRTQDLVERVATKIAGRDEPYERWHMLRDWHHRKNGGRTGGAGDTAQ